MKNSIREFTQISYETTFSAHYMNFRRPGNFLEELGSVVVIHSCRKDCNLKSKFFLTIGGARKVAKAVLSPSYKFHLFDNTNEIIVWKNRPEETLKWIHFRKGIANPNWPVYGPQVPAFMNQMEAGALLSVCDKFPFVEQYTGSGSKTDFNISFSPEELHWVTQDLPIGISSANRK